MPIVEFNAEFRSAETRTAGNGKTYVIARFEDEENRPFQMFVRDIPSVLKGDRVHLTLDLYQQNNVVRLNLLGCVRCKPEDE